MKSVDGIMYADDVAPDFKSIELTGREDNKRFYQGLKADADVVKTYINYPHLGAGSSVLFLDTAEIAYWSKTKAKWYLVGKGEL